MPIELPHNAGGPSRMVGADGRPIRPPQQAEPHAPSLPVQWSVDSHTGSVALIDTRTGSQFLFGADGILGFRDAFGTLLQTRPDGSLLIQAKQVFIVAEEQPDGKPGVQVVELKPRPPIEYADTKGVPSPDGPQAS